MTKSWDDLLDGEKDDVYSKMGKGRPYHFVRKWSGRLRVVENYDTDAAKDSQAAIKSKIENCKQRIEKYEPTARRTYKASIILPAIHKEQYMLYLQSNEWKERARRILERDSFTCRICDARCNLQVHHLTYDRKYNESDYDLITVCEQCHKAIHSLN